MWKIMVTGMALMLLFYVIGLYNNLVAVKNAVSKAWANIDVLLKQRHEELPKLVEVCKQYKQFERETLERVTQARSAVQQAGEQGDVRALGSAEGALRAGLGRLFAVAENYPDLKANESFMQLQQRISTLENAIADRRELYNDAANINNVLLESFPDNLIAGWFRFDKKLLLVFSIEETSNPDMKQLFSQ